MKRLCTILGIARSSFYYWRRTAADRAARQAADAHLAARIRAVHRESDGTYGVPRITAELREAPSPTSACTVPRGARATGCSPPWPVPSPHRIGAPSSTTPPRRSPRSCHAGPYGNCPAWARSSLNYRR
ncbi:IS3 family transposase [Streptomyces shenzhenensis]|uniref:IS3 family transposase n=1 Tax=Streptomyces shenzhenensis TaxID=943815 RepID=UPI0035572CAE